MKDKQIENDLEKIILDILENRFDIDPYQEGGKYSPTGVMEKYNLIGILVEKIEEYIDQQRAERVKSGEIKEDVTKLGEIKNIVYTSLNGWVNPEFKNNRIPPHSCEEQADYIAKQLITLFTPSQDEIKREALSDFHEKFWKWGISHMPTMYFNHVCNFLNDYIDETLTQSKEGGE